MMKPLSLTILLALLLLPTAALAQAPQQKDAQPFRAKVGVQAAAATLFDITDAANNPRLLLDDTGQLTIYGLIESTTGGFKFPDGTTQTTAATGGGGLWTASGSDIYYNAGLVGIGTTTPNTRLDVAAVSSSEPSIVTRGGYDYAATNGQQIDFGHWDGTTFTERMAINRDGDVGIGAVLYGAKLNVRINESNPLAFNVEKEDRTSLFIVTRIGSVGIGGSASDVRLNVRNDESKQFAFNVQQVNRTDLFTIADTGAITAKGPLAVSGLIESTTGGFKFPDGTTQTTAATGGGGGLWTASGSDIYYNAGLVGIGTDTPNTRLDVAAVSSSEPSIVTRGGYDYATTSGQFIHFGHWDGPTSTFTTRMGITGTGDVEIGGDTGIGHVNTNVKLNVRNDDSNTYAFNVEQSDGTNLFTIPNTGGIIAERPLAVSGLIESTTGGFKFPDGTTQTTAATGGGGGLWTASGSDIYYNAGLVGIGTSSPNTRLDVAAVTSSEPSIVTQGGKDYATTSGQQIDFGHWNGTTFTERMAISGDGEVGIGATNPNVKLNVKNIESHTYAFNVEQADGDNLFRVKDTGTIDILGKVGIGTPSPTAQLDVVAVGTEPSIVTRNGNDYATNSGQDLNFGHWGGATFTERMAISGDGDVGIGAVKAGVKLNVKNTGNRFNVLEVQDQNGGSLFSIFKEGAIVHDKNERLGFVS